MARASGNSLSRLLPERNTIVQSVSQDPSDLLEKLVDEVQDLVRKGDVVFLKRDTWSRAARRRQGTTMDSPAEQTTVRLAVVQVEGKWTIEFHWIQGRNRQLFQSFCSHVSRKVVCT